MQLKPGTRLGPYEVESAAGAGGMGEVYRARDTRLGRVVAIKLLAANLSDRPELRQRLEREAKAISQLAHPHICGLHDIGHQAGVDYLVLEYVEGETLERRLQRGPMPQELLLKTAIEVSAALEEAHRQGIIHRDLKPGNIMLTKAGAKLMDFGLAKVQPEAAPVAIALSEMATEDSKITGEGVIVGTFQYMAPEQLEGAEADVRSDIFALGTVLYEMATGRPAFTGRTKASLIAAILSGEAKPIAELVPLTPPAFERLVRACLAKDPEERIQSAHDIRLQLEWIAAGAVAQESAVRPRSRRERMVWVATTLLLLLATAASLLLSMRRTAAPATAVRFDVSPPPGYSFGDDWVFMAMAPDGKNLAFVANDAEGKPSVWVRPLDAFAARKLTAAPASGFGWSPDSRSLILGEIQRVPIQGAPPEQVCAIQLRLGLALNRAGIFLANLGSGRGLVRFSAEHCDPVEVTRLDTARHMAHAWPYFLPDDRHFLYAALATSKNHEIWQGSLDSPDTKLLLRNGSAPLYAAPGYLLFERHGVLLAQRFDWKAGELSGEPVQLVPEQLQFNDYYGVANFDASQTGVLIFQSQAQLTARLVWLDQKGRQAGAIQQEPEAFGDLRLSPDQSRIAVTRFDPQTHTGDLWLYDLQRRIWTRLTFHPAPGGMPAVWSPDGKRIVYRAASTAGFGNLYAIDAAGGNEQLLLHSADQMTPVDWSPDGRKVLLEHLAAEGSFGDMQLWTLDISSGQAAPLVQGPGGAAEGRFSPDGAWIAYSSNASGRAEIYLVRTSGGARVQVSTEGGHAPRWRSDGRHIFYLSAKGMLATAEVSLAGGNAKIGAVRDLFPLASDTEYAIARDSRILATVPASASEEPRIHVVVNWMADLPK